MVLNKRLATKVLFAVSAVVGVAMLLPLIVSLIYHELSVALSFAVCSVPMIVIGWLGFKFSKPAENEQLGLRDGFFIVGSVWMVLIVLGALPFIISGAIPSPADAIFETASGFSTMGGSILNDVENLPYGIHFWRSFTHWLGGMGILVLTIAILPMLGIGGQKIMRAETTGPSMDKITFTFNDSAKSLYLIYTGMTVAETLLLCCCGVNLFDAIIHSFGTVGTGGFSNHAQSIGYFNVPAQLVITLFMLMAGVNFNLYYLILTGKGKQAVKDTELRTYLAIVGGCTAFVTLMLVINKCEGGFFNSLRLAAFQVCSIISTTGYATGDFDVWPIPCRFIMMFLMFCGGCASSTSGGMKVIRIMLSAKIARRGVQKKIHPSAVSPVKVGGKPIAESTIRSVCEFLLLYLLAIAAGTLIVSLDGFDLISSFSTVLTCISNIGPGFNAVGPTMNFALYSPAIKVFLAVVMIAGRLELFTIFLLFTPAFWSKK